MLLVPFRHINQLKGTCEKFSDAYMIFLQSANIPPSLEDDIRRLSEHQVEQEDEDGNEVPYTWNFSRYVNFTNFTVSRAAVKIYSMKILPPCII